MLSRNGKNASEAKVTPLKSFMKASFSASVNGSAPGELLHPCLVFHLSNVAFSSARVH